MKTRSLSWCQMGIAWKGLVRTPYFYKMKIIQTLHRGAFGQFPFRDIYYYASNKSTGKETGRCIYVHCFKTDKILSRYIVSKRLSQLLWLSVIYKLTLINKIFFQNNAALIMFFFSPQPVSYTSIVNLLCVIKTEPRLILFHFTILKVLKIVTIYITKSSLASDSCMFQYWDSESCQFMNNIHFVNWGNYIKST